MTSSECHVHRGSRLHEPGRHGPHIALSKSSQVLQEVTAAQQAKLVHKGERHMSVLQGMMHSLLQCYLPGQDSRV